MIVIRAAPGANPPSPRKPIINFLMSYTLLTHELETPASFPQNNISMINLLSLSISEDIKSQDLCNLFPLHFKRDLMKSIKYRYFFSRGIDEIL